MIGTHLASLNLFRESPTVVEITVAGASPDGLKEAARANAARPIDYIEDLIVEAAERIKKRRAGDENIRRLQDEARAAGNATSG